MDTILFLQGIVYSDSYVRYIPTFAAGKVVCSTIDPPGPLGGISGLNIGTGYPVGAVHPVRSDDRWCCSDRYQAGQDLIENVTIPHLEAYLCSPPSFAYCRPGLFVLQYLVSDT
jgi:hypothetical protein